MRSIALMLGLSMSVLAGAVEVEAPLVQTGGLYADGGVSNSPTFQNYFVGYGTTPGFGRTAERRSFFVFDVPVMPGFVISGATLELRLPFGGLIFGKGPGDPLAGPVPSDTSETFSLGLLPVPADAVLSPALGGAGALAMFAAMDDIAIASPTTFSPGTPLPPAADGGPPIVPIIIEGPGLAALVSASGGSVVFSGWMPSWSEDLRLSPFPPPLYFEASELIFGLTDAHADPLLKPVLVLTLVPVPEPHAVILALLGLPLLAAVLARRRARRGTAGG